MKKYLVWILPAVASFTGVSLKAQDPIAKMKASAGTQDTVLQKLPAVRITTSNAFYKANKKIAIPFKPIPMTDKSGKAVPASQLVTLPNGRQMTAGAMFAQLNDLERKLNAQGYSLRNKGTVVTSATITPAATLDKKVQAVAQPLGPERSEDEIIRKMNPELVADNNMVLKPVGKYSADEKKRMADLLFSQQGEKLLVKPVKAPAIIKPGAPLSTPVKTVNETTARDFSFGSTSTIKAGLQFGVTRYAQVFAFDPAHAGKSKSVYKISANARLYASFFSRSFDAASGNAVFYAPQDSSKKMTANIVVKVGGVSILNINESYTQSKSGSGIKAKNVEESIEASIPVAGPIAVAVRGGIRGSIGFEYAYTVDHTTVTGLFKPAIDLKGFAEAGIGVGGVVEVGAGGQLIFIKGKLDLSGYFGIYNQNASQIVMAYGYYAGYSLTMLQGKLYCYAKVCVPDWVPFWGGDCSEYDHDLFSWTGFQRAGIIAEANKVFTINY